MRAEILDSTPLSGDFTETEYCARGDCLWVKFVDDDLSEWCGVFGKDGFTKNEVHLHTRLGQALVIAGGAGYWIDLSTRELLGKTDIWPTQSAVWPEELDFAILADWTNIYFATPEGRVWRSARVSLDDLSIDSYCERLVNARVFDTRWQEHHITVNVDTQQVNGAPAELNALD